MRPASPEPDPLTLAEVRRHSIETPMRERVELRRLTAFSPSLFGANDAGEPVELFLRRTALEDKFRKYLMQRAPWNARRGT